MGIDKFISIDQATKKCGYAIFENDIPIKYGILESTDKDIIKRIEEIYVQLYKIIKEYDIGYFIFEDTFSSLNIKVSKTLCWLQGAIMQLAFVEDCGFLIYAPTSWRKLLGFKNINKKNPQPQFKNNREYKKHQAIEYVNNKFNLNLQKEDDDIAEAICIGLAYLAERVTN